MFSSHFSALSLKPTFSDSLIFCSEKGKKQPYCFPVIDFTVEKCSCCLSVQFLHHYLKMNTLQCTCTPCLSIRSFTVVDINIDKLFIWKYFRYFLSLSFQTSRYQLRSLRGRYILDNFVIFFVGSIENIPISPWLSPILHLLLLLFHYYITRKPFQIWSK